jgi:hypothetical protein
MSTSSPAPVRGSTALPFGFRHRHASEEARAIAENGMMLRVQVGSGVHGTSISGQDDRDEMGLCLEPPGTRPCCSCCSCPMRRSSSETRPARSWPATRIASSPGWLRDSAAIADQPDRPWVDGWLHRSYQNFWDRRH